MQGRLNETLLNRQCTKRMPIGGKKQKARRILLNTILQNPAGGATLLHLVHS